MAWVAFEGKDVLAAFVQNVLGNLHLAAHGIDRNNMAVDIEPLQYFRDRRTFMTLVGDFFLPENNAGFGRKGAQDMEHVRLVVQAVTQAFAVNSNHLHLGFLGEALHPLPKEACNFFWIDMPEKSPKGISAGGAMGLLKILPQLGEVECAKILDILPAFRAADAGAEAQQYDFFDTIQLIPLSPWIGSCRKLIDETWVCFEGGACHLYTRFGLGGPALFFSSPWE